MSEKIILDGETLTLEKLENIVENNHKVILDDSVIDKVNKSRAVIDKIIKSKKVVYGVNTGFGYLKNTVVSDEDIEILQENLIISHSTGVGEYFSENVAKAMLVLRVNALIKGFSGIRLEVINLMVDFINLGITPLIPSQGSVGASGDLAPLSHMVLPLIGKGNVLYKGKQINVIEAMSENNLKPVILRAKEGLALINGTQAMTAVGAMTLIKAKKYIDIADSIASITIDALKGSKSAFRKELHIIRPHAGQIKTAENLTTLLENSPLMDSHWDCEQVQDAYSLRCIPQVHGAVRDSIDYAEKVLNTEMNSVTDNPIVLTETEEVISGGNFHGEPVAVVMDFLSIALSELGNISERRIERLVNPNLSNGLPAFLTKRSGLHSGYMIAQYTAAALVSENKSLAHPASVDSIPTSANQEDHVSMGTIGARKAAMIIKNLNNIMAIEALCAVQGIDLRKPLLSSERIMKIYELIRNQVPFLDVDRNISEDIHKISNLINSKDFFSHVKKSLNKNYN